MTNDVIMHSLETQWWRLIKKKYLSDFTTNRLPNHIGFPDAIQYLTLKYLFNLAGFPDNIVCILFKMPLNRALIQYKDVILPV